MERRNTFVFATMSRPFILGMMDSHKLNLRQKALGSSIMVSDVGTLDSFVTKKKLILCLESQKDGYFNSEMFLKQVDCCVDVFEQRFPDVTGIFLFDNTPSHRKFPPDGLNPGKMNVHPGNYEGHCLGRHTPKWRYQTKG